MSRVWRLGGVPTNTAVSAVRTVVRLLVGFALLPLLVHGIGSAPTGLFLFATTLTGYFTAVELTFGASVTRYVAEYRASGSSAELAAAIRGSLALLTAIGVVTASALAAVGLLAGHALFHETANRAAVIPALLVAAGTAVAYWPSRVGVAALNGLERYDQTASIQIASSLVILGGVAALAGNHASVPVLTGFFGVITVLEGIAAAALAWRPLGIDLSWTRGSWLRGSFLRGVARFGAATFVIGIADTLLYSFDRTIVSATVGATAIVAYELALRPQAAVRTISGLSGVALVAPVARLAAEGRYEDMRQLVLIGSFMSVAVTAPIAVLVITLAHPFVLAWFGAGFSRQSTYVQIFTSYWVLTCLTTAASSALVGIGRLREFARLVIVQAVVALVLSVIFALLWGTVGVIWGTVIPAAVSMPIFMRLALRLLGIAVRDFARDVAIPVYGMLAPWSALVIAAQLLLAPSGYAGLLAFSVSALIVWCVAVGPMLLTRWRRVTGGPPRQAPDFAEVTATDQ
ncbi:MAG: polysaccharide biosynthesis C-terminal domain-containing protein [Actinomycetota bacterium]|nr:polysaccharide biosynthesis C-terminal domain-containing protein [Actinomycetota bacterium]